MIVQMSDVKGGILADKYIRFAIIYRTLFGKWGSVLLFIEWVGLQI